MFVPATVYCVASASVVHVLNIDFVTLSENGTGPITIWVGRGAGKAPAARQLPYAFITFICACVGPLPDHLKALPVLDAATSNKIWPLTIIDTGVVPFARDAPKYVSE